MARKPKSELFSLLGLIHPDRIKRIQMKSDGAFDLELFPDRSPWVTAAHPPVSPEKEEKKSKAEIAVDQLEELYEELLLTDPLEAEKLRYEIMKKEGLQ